MISVKSLLDKLNIGERMVLSNYIKQEVAKQSLENASLLHQAAKEREELIQSENKKAWEIIDGNIQLAMRENKVSQERIDRILGRVLELTKENSHTKLSKLTEQPSKDFEILTKDEYRDLIEMLLEGHCKNCSKHSKDCEVYKLMKKHNAPYSGHKGKCKYAYSKNK